MKKAKKKPAGKRNVVQVNVETLDRIVDKAQVELLNPEECEQLRTCIHAMADRLMPLQRTSEKKDKLEADGAIDQAEGGAEPQKKTKRPGHGCQGAAAYTGAPIVPVPHQTLTAKEICPTCHKGKLYKRDPRALVRITAMPPIQGKVYHCEELRCNLCSSTFSAKPPDGVGEERYDESVPAMIALLKYGLGMPFYRIEKLQRQMGVPLASGTQFDLVNDAAVRLQPLFAEYIWQSAQAAVLTYDDTFARILDKVERPNTQDKDRTGLKTTGVIAVAEVGGHKIALFLTGPQHAGENVSDILKKRAADLPPVTGMSDASTSNNPTVPVGVTLLAANCLTHGRRQFVDVYENFPEECHHVIEQLGQVYHHDQQAKDLELSPEARLSFHQQKSGPVMDALKIWMEAQFAERKAEPNSGLGKAINYFLKRWERLTLFLRHPGAPLDSNIVEQSLKKAILHRKNCLFFKTQNGADVGDFFMSAIHTCELNGVNAFEYLHQLLLHVPQVRAKPAEWMPWNFRDQLSTPETG